MKLAKALKEKNKLVARVKVLQGLIQRDNSFVEGKKVSDVREYLEELIKVLAELISLKTAITKANIGVYQYLAQLEEVKSQIVYWKLVPTRQGEELGYQGTKTTWIVQISQKEIDEKLALLQLEAENLQDKIDEYNATHEVKV